MSSVTLLNLSVAITISDPWEFGTECGTGPFMGNVMDANSEMLVISLSEPVTYQGRTLHTVVVRPRYQGDLPGSVVSKAVSSNLMLLPASIRTIADVKSSNTRDGIAAIGTVEHQK